MDADQHWAIEQLREIGELKRQEAKLIKRRDELRKEEQSVAYELSFVVQALDHMWDRLELGLVNEELP